MLVFYCPDNRPGKHDGDEFAREARAFARLHDDAILVPLRGRYKYAPFRAACDEHAGKHFADVVYFGHGSRKGLPGLVAPATLRRFAMQLARVIAGGADVVLNACLCGVWLCGALAEELSDAGCCGCRVTGHTTAGHTTRNPYLVEATTVAGTRPLVRPHSPTWSRWVEWLKSGDNRFRAPWMDRLDIAEALGVDGVGVLTYHDGDPVLPPDWRTRIN